VTSKPLAGFGVVVTRPALQAAELVSAIELAGGRAIRFPVLDIIGTSSKAAAHAFAALPRPDLAIFVSQNAVRYGHSLVHGSTADIAAIGPATAAALEACGIGATVVAAGGFDSEHLLAHASLQDVAGKNVTIFRGTGGRALLGDTLESRGARVSYLTVYSRERHIPGKEELSALASACKNGSIDSVIIMSVESLRNYLQLLPEACRATLRRTPLVAPSERVIQTVQDLIPGAPTALAPGPQAADLVDALIAIKQSGQNQ
jgi:uroporphyrinogen-III synthase